MLAPHDQVQWTRALDIGYSEPERAHLDLLITKKIEMTFYRIMESISHLGKMARTSVKSANPIV